MPEIANNCEKIEGVKVPSIPENYTWCSEIISKTQDTEIFEKLEEVWNLGELWEDFSQDVKSKENAEMFEMIRLTLNLWLDIKKALHSLNLEEKKTLNKRLSTYLAEQEL